MKRTNQPRPFGAMNQAKCSLFQMSVLRFFIYCNGLIKIYAFGRSLNAVKELTNQFPKFVDSGVDEQTK